MTPAQVTAAWDLRDSRYAYRRHELTDDQITAVRTWRLQEAKTHAHLRHEAATWTPPVRIRV